MSSNDSEVAASATNAAESTSKAMGGDILSDGIVAIVVTAGAYVGAYVYEYAYLSFFGIPPELIEVSISTLVAVGGSLLILSTLVAQIGHIIWQFDGMGLFHPKNGWGLFIKKWSVLILLWCFSFWIRKFDWITWMTVGVWGFVILIDLVLPIFSAHKGKSYNHRLAEWLSSPAPQELTRHTVFKPGLPSKLLNTVLLVAIFSLGCSVFGTLFAKTRSGFGFVEGSDENAIIRKYDDHFILAKYDWGRAIFLRQFKIVKLDVMNSPIVFRKLPTRTSIVEDDSSKPALNGDSK